MFEYELTLLNKRIHKRAIHNYICVFTGLVPLESITYVTLQNDCNPVVGLPRCVPHSLKDCLQKAIEAIVRSGVLVKVDQPTD